MIIREVRPKTILSKSKIFPYVINPYVGCEHSCSYCYARFMKRFTGYKEPWGQFVDVKINAPDLLRSEVGRKKQDKVWISGVCDPYQPIEEKYKLTRQCLEILACAGWPVVIQTKSLLVLRDMDILKKGKNFEVGFSIATADDSVRRIFEPQAPPIKDRIRALDKLHSAGIRTYVMIAPILPGTVGLPEMLAGKVDYAIIDRMNYHYADWVYSKYGLENKMTDDFFCQTEQNLSSTFAKLGISC
ncbi:radical SAM protein [Patescibacteria group bacterium]|nr:radical SAM protein [Patescibacteria group bacterium]